MNCNKKIVSNLTKIKFGKQEKFKLGNIYSGAGGIQKIILRDV